MVKAPLTIDVIKFYVKIVHLFPEIMHISGQETLMLFNRLNNVFPMQKLSLQNQRR